MIKTLTTVFTQKTHEGTTERLLQLSFGYFALYVITGFLAKYFDKVIGVGGTTYTVFNTMGSMLIPTGIVLLLGWYKFKSTNYTKVLGVSMPKEFLYIIPSGLCTAVVIPTTTLMYTLPISVMVAMIIMRASIIVISRIIDEVQIRQGILTKKVYWEENIAVVIALGAVALQMLNFKGATAAAQAAGAKAFLPALFVIDKANFDFIGNAAAMTILTFYLIAYTIRIYIMNYYKNTRPKGAIYDTNGFFAIEQVTSFSALVLSGFIFFQVVNKPAELPFLPSAAPAAAATATAEKQALSAAMQKAQDLLASDTSKFTPAQRAETEEALAAASALLAAKKAKAEDLAAASAALDKPVKDVTRSFKFQFSNAFKHAPDRWKLVMFSGLPFGIAAFFSVFLFMFKGRTATFAGLVNRLTSLIAGTVATLFVFWLIPGQKMPKTEDWVGLVLMFIAIYFIGRSEKKRACELAKAHEVEPEKDTEICAPDNGAEVAKAAAKEQK
ncbi:MAG: hypothetical protein NDI60_10800 [Elusimicrobiales bacterium]|nr:hypothetical protein [Elusimicrobiales bacterium]